MLYLTISAGEAWDESKDEFVYVKEQTLQLEHSLVSLSKWESRWNKAFLSKEEKTVEETLDYIRCMTITQNVKPEVYNFLTNDHMKQIKDYIDAPMTATTFYEEGNKGSGSREVVTAELIYWWMLSLNIPMKCEKWHLNRLITLIRVTSIKNSPPKKMNKRQIMSRNKALNEARRQQLNTMG